MHIYARTNTHTYAHTHTHTHVCLPATAPSTAPCLRTPRRTHTHTHTHTHIHTHSHTHTHLSSLSICVCVSEGTFPKTALEIDWSVCTGTSFCVSICTFCPSVCVSICAFVPVKQENRVPAVLNWHQLLRQYLLVLRYLPSNTVLEPDFRFFST